MNHKQSLNVNFRQGFTIIETLLSMTFISILLLSVVHTTISTMQLYRKGVSLKEVNRVGRSITEDLTLAINQSTAITLPTDAAAIGAPSLPVGLNQNHLANSTLPIKTSFRYTASEGGVFCTGQVSYLWTAPSKLTEVGSLSISNAKRLWRFGNSRTELIRFGKVNDPNQDYCHKTPQKIANPLPRDQVVELIKPGDRYLALQDFQILASRTNGDTGQSLYAINFVLGTFRTGSIITNASCSPPGGVDGDLQDYCAINKFSVTARNIRQ